MTIRITGLCQVYPYSLITIMSYNAYNKIISRLKKCSIYKIAYTRLFNNNFPSFVGLDCHKPVNDGNTTWLLIYILLVGNVLAHVQHFASFLVTNFYTIPLLLS